MSKNENRLNFRMTDETAAKIERWYQEDNCRSKNEFIEKAVNCYADMLTAGESTTLPRAVQSAIDARLKIRATKRGGNCNARWRITTPKIKRECVRRCLSKRNFARSRTPS